MHKQFLLAALEQARIGQGRCAPNPSVGAVAVHNNQIIAQTRHGGPGTPHAEPLLLDMLSQPLEDVTLYTSLEPCNHWGRTPPCVDAIIRRGIRRVVCAYRDPNPIVSQNDTPAIFQRHGVEFIHYPLPEIDSFYESYRYWTFTKKPWVTVKIAQTFDGKIAGAHGERISVSNKNCAVFTHQQRLEADVILTTASTVNQDDPLLNVRLSDTACSKPVAILDRSAILNPQARIFKSASHCHVYYAEGVSAPKLNNCTAHFVPETSGKLDLEAVISHLGTLGYHDVWVEAGAVLFNALHAQKLVNRTYVYLAPMALGQAATPLYTEGDIFSEAASVGWQLVDDNVIAAFDWSSSTLRDITCLQD